MTADGDELAGRVQQRLVEVENELHGVALRTRSLYDDERALRYLDVVDEASAHLIDAGGKRLRPVLTLVASHLGDPEGPEVVQAALAVELTHLASLYHDDVMDSADTRRGVPAAHAVWGNTVAILVGDLLFARASGVVAQLGPQAVAIQAETFERLCLGQLAETVGPRGGDPVQHYLRVLADKTGALIATCGQYGTMFAGCDAATVEVLRRYGEKVGIAFQLADDVLDLSEDDVTGKNAGTDLREHVPTMPALIARQAAAEGDRDAATLVQLIDGDLSDDADLGRAVAGLRDSAAAEQTLSMARSWAADAVAVLDQLPPSAVRTALADFADSTVNRTA